VVWRHQVGISFTHIISTQPDHFVQIGVSEISNVDRARGRPDPLARQILLVILVYLICSVVQPVFKTLASVDTKAFRPLSDSFFSWYQSPTLNNTIVTVTHVVANPTTITELQTAGPTTITVQMVGPMGSTGSAASPMRTETDYEFQDTTIQAEAEMAFGPEDGMD
jgi:hypothetical protein